MTADVDGSSACHCPQKMNGIQKCLFTRHQVMGHHDKVIHLPAFSYIQMYQFYNWYEFHQDIILGKIGCLSREPDQPINKIKADRIVILILYSHLPTVTTVTW